MKKYLKYIPHVIFALSMIIMGAKGKLLGADKAIGLFKMLKLFGQPEYVGRYLIGGAELLAGVGIFFKITERYAAGLGIILMISALYFHATILGMNIAGPAIITLFVAIWIFVKTYKKHNHATCTDESCEIK